MIASALQIFLHPWSAGQKPVCCICGRSGAVGQRARRARLHSLSWNVRKHEPPVQPGYWFMERVWVARGAIATNEWVMPSGRRSPISRPAIRA
jgi:hypothetical protein